MSKLTQEHVDCLVRWMKNHPGETPKVAAIWRNNGMVSVPMQSAGP